MGDKGDNIKGVKGIGGFNYKDFLNEDAKEHELWEQIIQAFKIKEDLSDSEAKEKALLNMRLVNMHQMTHHGVIKLWEPEFKKAFSLKKHKNLISKEFLKTFLKQKSLLILIFKKKKLSLALLLTFGKPFAIDCKNGIFLKQKLPKKDKRTISKTFSRGFRIISIHIPPTHIKRQTPISPNPKTAH